MPNGAPRRAAHARARAVGLLAATAVVAGAWLCAHAQEAPGVGMLSGTLKKVKETGAITLGYRESSLPFSYLNRRQQAIGYAIDLCREIVEDVSTELDGMEVKIGFAPVTPANRLQKVASSDIGRYQVDAGRTVVVTAGTTNETALSTLAQKQRIGMSIVSDRLVVSNPKSKAN